MRVETKFLEVSTYVREFIKDHSNSSQSEEHDHSTDPSDTIDIPIKGISYQTMQQVILWCKHHYSFKRGTPDSNKDEEEERRDIESIGAWSDDQMDRFQTKMSKGVTDFWEREFLDIGADKLKDIIFAANILGIEPLIRSSSAMIAEIFRRHSPKEVLEALNKALSSKTV